MSKFEPPAWVTEHLRIYRESGEPKGTCGRRVLPGSRPRALPIAHHDRAAFGQEADVAFVL